MSRHTVTERDLEDWAAGHWVPFASSADERSNKRMEVNLRGLYRVIDHGVTVYIGGLKETAIREYNEAR